MWTLTRLGTLFFHNQTGLHPGGRDMSMVVADRRY